MASTSTRGESSISSSSLPPQILFDVFLSFRGADTRCNFTDHLCAALVRHGIDTFRDNKIKRGEQIGPELLKIIEGSRISVIVFSRNYADSRWCLDELVKILECKSTFQQIVLPVFYHVDPSDVRAQRGSFAEAFAKHEDRYKGGGMEGKLEEWRNALREASNLSGWHLQNVADGYESKFVENIVEDILIKLNPKCLNVATYPVGIESHVQDVKGLLSMESDDVRMIGILGTGGIGKTTIAKAIYNLLYLKFDSSSFVANIREFSKRPNGVVGLQELVGLQEQLLSDILGNQIRNIRNVDQGIELIKQRVSRRKVLIVLDDVDEIKQLKALAIKRDWFYPGSRVIVTTRDESLLKLLKVDGVYEPKLLDHYKSLELFSWHAFGKNHPRKDFAELSWKVVGYAKGLPLVLEVLGSFLLDKSKHEWQSTLEKLKRIPHQEIHEKLKISFDSLTTEEKNLFLDITCFFVGMDHNYTMKILEACGFFPGIEIGVLVRQCLVRIDGLNQLMVHDMLRDMGREIVRNECSKKPGERTRLWFHEDVLDVLINHTGTEAVEGLVINLPRSNDVRVNAQAFAKMKNLRLLKLNNVHLGGNYRHLSNSLRWLCWFGFPLKSIPSNLFMDKVVVIDMRYSNLKQVWKGRKILNQLKILNLSHSYHLTETPDLSGCTSLEMLLLNYCTSLVEVHQSIENLHKLVALDLENCKNLMKLPPGIRKLKFLTIRIFGCSKLEKFPGFEGTASKSQFPCVSSRASLVRNPSSISLSLASTQGLVSLTNVNLAYCNLSHLPDELWSLFHEGNISCALPASGDGNFDLADWFFESLPKLQYARFTMRIFGCSKLEKFPGFEGLASKSQFPRVSSRASLVRNPTLIWHIAVSLTHANLAYCYLSHRPDELWSLTSLTTTFFKGRVFLTSPASGDDNFALTDLDRTILPMPMCVVRVLAMQCLHFFGYKWGCK